MTALAGDDDSSSGGAMSDSSSSSISPGSLSMDTSWASAAPSAPSDSGGGEYGGTMPSLLNPQQAYSPSLGTPQLSASMVQQPTYSAPSGPSLGIPQLSAPMVEQAPSYTTPGQLQAPYLQQQAQYQQAQQALKPVTSAISATPAGMALNVISSLAQTGAVIAQSKQNSDQAASDSRAAKAAADAAAAQQAQAARDAAAAQAAANLKPSGPAAARLAAAKRNLAAAQARLSKFQAAHAQAAQVAAVASAKLQNVVDKVKAKTHPKMSMVWPVVGIVLVGSAIAYGVTHRAKSSYKAKR